MTTTPNLLEECRVRCRAMALAHGMANDGITVRARALSPEEAIGQPGRRDYPILTGVERVLEATIRETRGQAFSDAVSDFRGTFREVLELPLDTNHNRALFLSTINAALHHLGMISGTVHCKNNAPELCGRQAATFACACGAQSVGLIGFNPALADALAQAFGPDRVRITDLNPGNVGSNRYGTTILDGRSRTRELIEFSDLVLVTGTTFVNGTFDAIHHHARSCRKRLIVFGITGAAVCHIMDLQRWCPQAQDGRPPVKQA